VPNLIFYKIYSIIYIVNDKNIKKEEQWN
jgi:hypothetical protein